MDKNDATQTLGFWLIKFKTSKLQGNMCCDPFDDEQGFHRFGQISHL